jgi:hypothetical protein
MFSSSQIKKSSVSNLVRLHPKNGGVNIEFGGQSFHGVSTDVFLGLDLNDLSETYQNSRKLNLSISVNPSCWSTEDLLSYLTFGELERTQKCKFHGDIDTGLRASEKLKGLLKLKQLGNALEVDGVAYAYHSIGVACNSRYQSVSHRQGNAFEKSSSHFEIKFRRQSGEDGPDEYLCLNIHLMPENTKAFGKQHALERLKQAIHLFYVELGLNLAPASYIPVTKLITALYVTRSNYEELGFSCIHRQSQDVLENSVIASEHSHRKSSIGSLSVWDYIEKSMSAKSGTPLGEPAHTSVTDNEASPPTVEVKPVANAWSKKLKF